jgi:hypothetical protein
MSSARSYAFRARSNLPSPRAGDAERHLRLGVVRIDLDARSSSARAFL